MANSRISMQRWRRSLQAVGVPYRFSLAVQHARRERDAAMTRAFAWRPQDAHNRNYRRDHVWPAIPEDPISVALENDIRDPQFIQLLPPIPGAYLFDDAQDQWVREW